MLEQSTGKSRRELSATARREGLSLGAYCENQLVEEHVVRISHGFLSATLALCWPENLPGMEQAAHSITQQTFRTIHAKTYANHAAFMRGILGEFGKAVISAIEHVDTADEN